MDPDRSLEQLLHRTEERLRAVLDHAGIILFAVDRNRVITLSEGRGLEGLGLRPGEAVGKTVDELYGDNPDVLANLRRALAGEEFTHVTELPGPVFLETRFCPRFDASGAVIEFIGVSLDVTARVLAERRMVEADRLAALGTLAAGVAHEINNPLTYALLNLSLIERGLDPQDRSADLLGEARSGIERVARVVQDLATLAREDTQRPEPVELCKLLESVVGTTGSLVRKRARLVAQCDPVPPVRGSEARLGQVFVNLIANAAASVPEGAPNQHVVELRALTDERRQAVVRISHSGPTLSPEGLRRVFEPFYGGAGLGLSISHAIVTSLGGTIHVESPPGQGTRFTVTLPPAAPAGAGAAGTVASARPRLLVVDDEPVLAQAIAEALADLCDVDAVTGGAAALERVAEGHDYDLILCDLMMPSLSGMDLHDALTRRRPPLAERMVFMTGGRVTPEANRFAATMKGRILEKPFDLAFLQSMVRGRLGI